MTMDEIFAWFRAMVMDETFGWFRDMTMDKIIAWLRPRTMDDLGADFCYVALSIPMLISLVPTWGSWKRNALGPGDRWPHSTIAALFANAAWFSFGWIVNSREPFWVNFCCGLVQMVNLRIYLKLCTSDERERRGVLLWSLLGAAYLAITLGVGFRGDAVWLFKVLCTISGFIAALMPLVVAVFMIEPKTTDLLPKWYVSAASIFNGIAWCVRGVLISNIPMAVQNGAGVFCFACLLVLLFRWDKPRTNHAQLEPFIQDTSQTRDNEASTTKDPIQDLQKYNPPKLQDPPSGSAHSKNAMDGAGSSNTNAKDKNADYNDEKDKKNEQTGSSSTHKDCASATPSAQEDTTINSKKDAGGKHAVTGSSSSQKDGTDDRENEDDGSALPSPHEDSTSNVKKDAVTGSSSAPKDGDTDLKDKYGGNGSASPSAHVDSTIDVKDAVTSSSSAPKDGATDLKDKYGGNGSASPSAHLDSTIDVKEVGAKDAFIIEVKDTSDESGAPKETSTTSPAREATTPASHAEGQTMKKTDPPSPANKE